MALPSTYLARNAGASCTHSSTATYRAHAWQAGHAWQAAQAGQSTPACQACVGVGVQHPIDNRHGSMACTLTIYLLLDRPSPGLILPLLLPSLACLAPSTDETSVSTYLAACCAACKLMPFCRLCPSFSPSAPFPFVLTGAYKERKDAPRIPFKAVL